MTQASSQGSVVSAENKMQVPSFTFTPISIEENNKRKAESDDDDDENLVDIKRTKINEPLGKTCPLHCGFPAATKNQYRHMQDHLANVHFKDELALDLPKNKKPYQCPLSECNAIFKIHQDLKRHYIGNQHYTVMKSYLEYAKKRDAGLLVNRPMGEE